MSSNQLAGLQPEDLIPDVRLREVDEDAFAHAPIAARVAELAVQTTTPCNIALFGSWGSGKSSFYELLRSDLARIEPDLKVVRYDAWKYGGAALKRNFISSVATDLNLDDRKDATRKYHRGLYEKRKLVSIDPLELVRDGKWKSYAQVIVFAALGAVVATLLASWFTTVASHRDFSDEFSRFAPGVGTWIGGVLLALAGAAKLLEGAKVEVDEAVPSEDEQFSALFRELVNEVTDAKRIANGKTGLLCFIDELDRCSKSDVVATLTSLRTFLDQPGCVFVVAADREVLEEALTELEQATPEREEEPYYSSASAFLDKIFQHQFALPPLHGGRLTGFARALVVDRGGLWQDLRTADRLNDVLYTLIPPHVRAPRRVKVLLNNFATNARVSQARGIDWLGRSAEIAKLTVLQTEFPRLARDLHHEPRLPGLLLSPPPQPSRRQRPLLDRHRLTDVSAPPAPSVDEDEELPVGPADASAGTYETPDRLLTDVDNPELMNRQRDDLARYLQSRSATRDPGRDLLFLEPAGQWTGFVDPDLNDLIELEAPNRPQLVIDALENRSESERLAAARLLGHLSEGEYGTERSNMITALAGTLAGLPVDVIASDIGDLLANVRSFQTESTLTADQLPGLLRLAVAGGPAGRDLAAKVLDNPSLLATPDRVATVAPMLPDLDDATAATVEQKVGELYLERPDILLNALSSQTPQLASRLMRRARPAVVSALSSAAPAAVVSILSSGSLASRAEDLLAVLDERPELLAEETALVIGMLRGEEETVIDVCRTRAPRLADNAASEVRNTLALLGLRYDDVTQWPFWSNLLVEDAGPRTDGLQIDVLHWVFDDLRSQAADVVRQAPALVQAVLAAGEFDPADSDVAELAEAMVGNLAPVVWWVSQDETSQQRAMYDAAAILAAVHASLAGAFAGAARADLVRTDPNVLVWDTDIARRVIHVAVAAPAEVLSEWLALVPAGGDAPDTRTLVRLRANAELRRRGLAAGVVPGVEAVEAARIKGPATDEILTAWFEQRPNAAETVSVLEGVADFRRGVEPAVREYFTDLSEDEATVTYLALVKGSCNANWFAASSTNVNAEKAVADLANAMRAAPRELERERVAAAISEVPLSTFAARRDVADIAIELLAPPSSQSKGETASRLAEQVVSTGENFGRKQALESAAAAARDRKDLSDRSRKRFEKNGLLVKRKKGFLEAIFDR